MITSTRTCQPVWTGPRHDDETGATMFNRLSAGSVRPTGAAGGTSPRRSRARRRLTSIALAVASAVSLTAAVAPQAQALPNLVVTNVSPAIAATGDKVSFKATVKNTGTTGTMAGTIIGVRFSVDGAVATWSDTSTTSLTAGSSRTLVANNGPLGTATWSASTGQHTLSAWVDDVNRITESNEFDNKLGAPLSVTATTAPANLVVSGISAVTAKEGDLVSFSATIRNAGGTATPSGIIHGVAFSIDGVAKTWSDTSTASLAPGATRILSANSGVNGFATWAAIAGAHRLVATVDDVDRIDEGDETDNSLALAINVAMKPRVFAHWHHSAQRAISNVNDVASYQAEIRKAKAMGIDGFAYNVINVSLELPEIANLYTAAHLEGNFYLFPSADQCCSMTDAQLDQLAFDHYADSARLRMDGGRYGSNLPVMQTWHGEAKGAAYWKSRQDSWKAAGKPMFYIPYFSPGGGTVDSLYGAYDGNTIGQSDDVVDGFYNFSGWASLTDPLAAATRNHSFATAAAARPGMDAMFGCAPNFNRHSGSADVENRVIGNFQGFHTWITCLQQLVADNPRFVEYPTWNDYLEGSYLGGPYTRTQLWANFRGNEYSHDAFRAIGSYYGQWFKTGRQPQITTDLIAIAHRPHRACAPGPHPGSDGSATCSAAANDTDNAEHRTTTVASTTVRPLLRQVGGSTEDDRLYAAVILKSPGRVTLTTGTQSTSWDLPAGMSEVSRPFAVGTQSIKLERGGSLIESATSAVQIVAVPNVFNYNVATAFAEK